MVVESVEAGKYRIAFPVAYDHGQRTISKLVLDVYYVTEPAVLDEAVAWARGVKALGLDLETSGLDPRDSYIATLQFGNPIGDGPRIYVVDVRCFTAEQLTPLLEILETVKVYGMNLSFEYRFLRHHYNRRLRRVVDVQLAELILRSGLFPASEKADGGFEQTRAAYMFTSLLSLTRRYLQVNPPLLDEKGKKDKELRTSFHKVAPGCHTKEQIEYAAGDIVYPFLIWKKQRRERDERGLKGILDIEFQTLPVLAESQYYGFRLDVEEWRQLWQEAIVGKAKAEKVLDDLFVPICPQQDLFGNARPVHPGKKRSKKSGRGKTALDYGAATDLKWAFSAYCKHIQWPIEIVTSKARLRELKQKYGQDFLDGRRSRGKKAEVDDVPEYLIPEDKYCIAVSMLADKLRLAMIRRQLPEELVRAHLEYAKYAKRISTYGMSFVEQHVRKDTGRIHTTFHQALASTGRISTEPNLQNIPHDRRYRACFKPAPGYKFVIADYSQIEPRLSAEVSDDPVYVSTFTDGDDIYCRVCEAMTGTYPDKKTEEGKLQRQIFKVIVLALAYRMGPWKLRDRLTLALEKEILSGKLQAPTFEYARELRDGFFARCSGIATYQDQCSDHADCTRERSPKLYDIYADAMVTWIEAPCGRKRFFRPGSRTYTEGPNAPIQGCSATITKAAAVLVQRVIDGRAVHIVDGHPVSGFDAHCVNLIHDEIVWEVREDQAAEFAVVAKELMEQAGRLWIKRVPVLAEFPKGTSGAVDCWMKEAA